MPANFRDTRTNWRQQAFDKVVALYKKPGVLPHRAQSQVKELGFSHLPHNCLPNFWIDKDFAILQPDELAAYLKADPACLCIPRADTRPGEQKKRQDAFLGSLKRFLLQNRLIHQDVLP